jgi:hypothetical protein
LIGVFAQEFDETGNAAFFVGAEVIVDVPAEIVLAEFTIVFVAALDDVVKGVEAEIASFAQLGAEGFETGFSLEDPKGVDEWETSQVVPGGAEIPDLVSGVGAAEVDGGVADQENVGFLGGGPCEVLELWMEAAFREEDPQEPDAGAGFRQAVNDADRVERLAVGEENTEDLPEAGDGDAIEHVVTVVEERLGNTEEGGVQFAGAHLFGELGRWNELYFAFQAASERDGVQVRDGADAKGGEGAFEIDLTAPFRGETLAFDAADKVFGGYAGCQA